MYAIMNKQTGKYEITHIETDGAIELQYDGNGEITNIELKAQILEEKVYQQEQEDIKNASHYLKDTDWYYARKMETGEEVPADVVANRIVAREYLRNRGNL